jgi:hypothetical protein
MSSASLCKFCFALVENLFPLNPNGFAKCRKSHTPDTPSTKTAAPAAETCTGGVRIRSCHRRATEAAFLNEIDQAADTLRSWKRSG